MSTVETERPYTVVVGVSATSKSPAALIWGAAQAQANDGVLVAVRVIKVPFPDDLPQGATSGRIPRISDVLAQERNRLKEDVDDVLGPGNGAEIRVVHGGKRRGLVLEAQDADLLVIDAPRQPSSSPLLAQRIVASVSCPVVVMPASISGQPPSAIGRAGQAVGRAALRAVGTSGRPGYRPPSTS